MRIPAASLAAIAALAGCAGAEVWPGPSRPYEGRPHRIPGLIETEHFDEGGEGFAFHDLDEKNQGVPYRPGGVDIEPREDASNRHNIGWVRAGEWLNYTVDILETGTYLLEMRVASHKKGGVFHLEVDGVDVTGPIELPDTGGWKFMKPLAVPGVKLRKGLSVLRCVMDKDGESKGIGDIDFFRFVRQ
jgi:hypothetical protein